MECNILAFFFYLDSFAEIGMLYSGSIHYFSQNGAKIIKYNALSARLGSKMSFSHIRLIGPFTVTQTKIVKKLPMKYFFVCNT